MGRGMEIRTNARQMIQTTFINGITKQLDQNKQNPITISNELQKAINAVSEIIERTVYYSWFVFDYQIYAKTIRSLVTFIEKRPWKFLELDPTYTSTMPEYQLAEYRFKEKSTEYEEFMKTNVYGNGGDIVCRKCKTQGQIITYSVHIRAADEPSTQFYLCSVCGNKWKE
jgi:DNA-directed RNA polymerase subunit M/transcription elongation factor TFIIS